MTSEQLGGIVVLIIVLFLGYILGPIVWEKLKA